MTPLERAARAIGERLGMHLEVAEDAYDHVLTEAARDAIATIRDLPPETRAAAVRKVGQMGSAHEYYVALIDAALAEEG